MGTVYRYERSGVLHGLLRVRGFTQDDAHIFCTPDQLKNEMIECVKLAKYLMETFGFTDYQVNLSTRGEKYIGDISRWEEAEKTLSEALDEISIKYTVDPGEAVFYGPKIDIKIKDCLGRLWQGPTIQFDFNLPERFNVKYIANDGKEHYVYMVHRAMFGSFERFFGCLIEHYAGAFPLWLAPTQLMLIPVSEKHLNECEKIKNILENENIRVKIDSRNEKLNFKIRSSQVEKIPYMAIIGDREVEQSTVSLRSAKKGDLGNMPVKDALLKLMEEIKLKS